MLTLAGYIAPLSVWEQFEEHADNACGNYNVPIFHAHEFHRTKDEYKGWSSIKKASFIDELYAVPPTFGISVSIRKNTYKERQSETGLNKSMSAYGVAFASIAAALVTNYSVSGDIREQGLSFIVEAGHNNNAEIEKYFNKFKHHEFFRGVLRSITFSGKEESRAIQLADLYAYYSRRHAAKSDKFDGNLALPSERAYARMLMKCPHFPQLIKNPYTARFEGVKDGKLYGETPIA